MRIMALNIKPSSSIQTILTAVCASFFFMLLPACTDNRPNVIFETDMGDIEIEVYADKAPLSAADFLYYVDEGLYDDQGFYRVVRNDNDPRNMGMSLIQGGRLDLYPLTPSIGHETTQTTGLSNRAGAVSIARDEPGTGSAAYFFINADDNQFLDFGGERNPDGQGYAVFGQVISGMDVVRAIQAGDTRTETEIVGSEGQFLTQTVHIKRAYRK